MKQTVKQPVNQQRPVHYPFHAALALFLTGIFALDLSTPLGFADGVIYVIPVLLALRGKNERLTLNVALLSTVLVLAGLYLSPPGSSAMSVVLFNRIVAFLAIWSTAWLGLLGERKDRHLRRMIETVNEGVITIDDDGRIREFNPAAERIFGYSAAEVLRQNVKLLMPEPFSSAHDGYLSRYQETGEARVIGHIRELRGVRKDGAIFPMELTLSEMQLGRHRLFTGLVRDIEDRKRTERELQQIEARLKLAQHIAGLGFFENDIAMGQVYWSDEVYAIYGIGKEGFNPKIETVLAMTVPEDRGLVSSEVRSAVDTGAIFDFKHRILRSDGELRYLHVQGEVLHDPQGEPQKQFGTIMDITEQELQAQAITRYRDIVNATTDLMLVIDRDYVFRAANDAYLKSRGKSREEVIGHTISEVLGEDFFQEISKPDIDRCLLGETLNVQHWMKSQPKGDVFLDIHYLPSRDTSGEINGVVISAHDLTERKKFELALETAKEGAEEANKTKARFLANMSHELHTPLTAIIGYSEMLKDQAEEEGHTGIIQDLESIRSAGVRLLGLIDNILDQASLEAGKITLAPRRFKLRELIAEIASSQEPVAAEKGNRLRVLMADEVDTMTADPFRLRQCLIHLLNNAARYTTQGEISLSVRSMARTGKWLEFTVSDTGIGMTEAQLKKLFKPLMPVNEQANIGSTGAGLGLSIVHGLVTLMGGEISASSEWGKGSSFTLSLPAYAEPSSSTIALDA